VFWYATLRDGANHSWRFKEARSRHLKSQAGPSYDGTNLSRDIRTIHPEICITSLKTWFLRSLVIYPEDKIQKFFVMWKLQISCRHYRSHELLVFLYAILEWNGLLRPIAVWQVILTKWVCGKQHQFLPHAHGPILRFLCAKEISPAHIIRLSIHPNSLKHTTYSRTSVSFHRLHTVLIQLIFCGDIIPYIRHSNYPQYEQARWKYDICNWPLKYMFYTFKLYWQTTFVTKF